MAMNTDVQCSTLGCTLTSPPLHQTGPKCHWIRMISEEYWWVQFCPYLFAKLDQNIVEFLHHLWIDGFPRADVSKLQQHIKGAFRRPQGLERIVDEMLCFVFNGRHFAMEPVHYVAPAGLVPQTEGVKPNLQQRKSSRDCSAALATLEALSRRLSMS